MCYVKILDKHLRRAGLTYFNILVDYDFTGCSVRFNGSSQINNKMSMEEMSFLSLNISYRLDDPFSDECRQDVI